MRSIHQRKSMDGNYAQEITLHAIDDRRNEIKAAVRCRCSLGSVADRTAGVGGDPGPCRRSRGWSASPHGHGEETVQRSL